MFINLLNSKSKLRTGLFVYFCLVFGMVIVVYLLKKISNIEDIQSIFIPVFVSVVFFVTTKYKIVIPKILFVFTLFIWLFLVLRVPIMNYFNYFDARLIVGKFYNDDGGYEARETFKSLKLISTTYHLPGPSLLQFLDSKYDSSKLSVINFKKNRIPPALFVFGTKNGIELVMPEVDFLNIENCLDITNAVQCEALPSSTLLFEKFSGFSWAIAPLPKKLLVRKQPEYVMYHYISWLSAYFSKNINYDKISRIDILTEILNLKSLPVQSDELLFAKLIFSYEQLFSEDIGYNNFDQIQIRRRLNDVRRISKKFSNPEFYGMSMNMLALLATFENSEEDSFFKAKSILRAIIKNKKISIRQRQIAAHNLGELELKFN
jgi:hypothetical protein